MKYWLIAVSSAQSTSCRTWTTSSFPFMEIPFCERRKGDLNPPSAAGGEMIVQVRQAGGAQAAAAGLGLELLEALALVAPAARDLVERHAGALAARHRAPAADRLDQHRRTHLTPIIMKSGFIFK